MSGHVHPSGHVHEALLYDSDEQLLSVAAPFVRAGAAAGEPVIVAYGARNAALLRRALPAGAPVEFLDGAEWYARPAGAIRAYRQLLADHVAAGAPRVRLVGELDPSVFGARWHWWARYESAVNHAYDEFPVSTLCCYDTRTAPPHVLTDIRRCHPTVHGCGTADYAPPDVFLREPSGAPDDPLRRGTPVLDLEDPSPAGARHAVRGAGSHHLGDIDLENLVLSVSEAVTNAAKYGQPPVRVRCWAEGRRVLVAVTDGGDGPKELYAGLLPMTSGQPGGLGLWITFQSCSNVVLARDGDGFTVWMAAGPAE
jgi:anti-sigma regulatory factor (Ser/Thr protein kinase)